MVNEASIARTVKVNATKIGMRLFRNNVGCFVQEPSGRLIRYGLANDSKKMNHVFKSSDFIGINPVTITLDMVGQTIGQFVAIETKNPTWSYRGTDAEKAQLSFLNLVQSMGGYACFNSTGVVTV